MNTTIAAKQLVAEIATRNPGQSPERIRDLAISTIKIMSDMEVTTAMSGREGATQMRAGGAAPGSCPLTMSEQAHALAKEAGISLDQAMRRVSQANRATFVRGR
ncbi:MAG: hypothetical protein JWP97_5404 [Labilithrix sp.]|nr:hypothetical protein [Labilithrix sp.]